jgi:hypothetical protein
MKKLRLALEQGARGPRIMQLATVTRAGHPANRTVVFRGFGSDEESLSFVTDPRSRFRWSPFSFESLRHSAAKLSETVVWRPITDHRTPNTLMLGQFMDPCVHLLNIFAKMQPATAKLGAGGTSQ